jgi:hypothetical protein
MPSSTGGVDILLGNGDGTIQPAVSYPDGGAIGLPIAGDFNGDGKLDLAFCDGGGSGNVFLVLGNGDGSFQPPLIFPSFGLGVDMTAGDFNGDGLLDLAITNVYANTVSVALQTTLLVSPSSLGFSAQGVLTTSPPQSITLTNIGPAAIPINSVTITGADAGVFAETSACGTSLAAGASCTISVTFTPKKKQQFVATLDIADGAVGSPQQVALSGNGEFARVRINPGSIQFGSQAVGTTSSPQTVKVSVRVWALAVTSISFIGVNASDFAQINNCPPIIAPNTSCKITVTFTPSGTGTRSAKLILRGGFEGGFTDVLLNGTGIN